MVFSWNNKELSISGRFILDWEMAPDICIVSLVILFANRLLVWSRILASVDVCDYLQINRGEIPTCVGHLKRLLINNWIRSRMTMCRNLGKVICIYFYFINWFLLLYIRRVINYLIYLTSTETFNKSLHLENLPTELNILYVIVPNNRVPNI